MIFQALSVKPAPAPTEPAVRTRLLGHHSDWFVPGLYKNELRRTWSMGLLLAIVLFFAVPVYHLLVFSNRARAFAEYPDRALAHLREYFCTANPMLTVFAALAGMLCAMVVTEYLFDRRKVNFVCSLPVKRQAYLITKAAANVTWAVLAWIPATVLMTLVACLTEAMRPHLGLVLGGCVLLLGTWLCLYLYFFGLTVLACCFCGTGIMGGCMLLMLGGYVPLTVLSLIGLADMTLSRINTNYYVSEPFFSAISGVFRIFVRTAEEKSVLFLLGCAVLGLLLFAAGVLLTVIRQSETAGTPFAFACVRDLVKYLLMGLAALLGGMLFEAMSAGYFTIVWMLFGCVCGAVLCWMLCNTVFYKTPKMMFEGKRGLAILTACMLVFSACARFDVLGIDAYIPSVTMTRQVEIDGRTTFSFRDKSLVRIFNAMAKNGQTLYDRAGPNALLYAPMSSYKENPDQPWLINVGCAVWQTNYLFPVAKELYASYEDWASFVGSLTAREDFADLYFADLLQKAAKMPAEETCYMRFDAGDGTISARGASGSGHITPDALRTLLETFREEMRALGADAMQQVFIGTLYFRLDGGYYEIPLFSAYEKTVAAAREVLRMGGSEHHDIRYETVFLKANVIRNGEVIDTLTEAEVTEMREAGILSGSWNSYETPMTLIDPSYLVEITYRVNETGTYTYYEETYSADGYTVAAEPQEKPGNSTYESTAQVCFFYGCVPEEYAK